MAKGICVVEDCENPCRAKGWCASHYGRWQRHGDPLAGNVIHKYPDVCAVPDCEKPEKARGWCGMHYWRWSESGQTEHPNAKWAIMPGQRFGMLTAGRSLGVLKTGQGVTWLCHCDCGNEATPFASVLRCGRIQSCGCQANRRDGQPLTYHGAHRRVTRVRGRAQNHECVDCGRRADEWSYGHADPAELNELTDKSGRPRMLPYSLDVDHYAPRCRSCHFHFDRPDVVHHSLDGRETHE